jgi:uncharacterized protein
VERVITVNGTGAVSAPPDRARLDLRVGATSASVRSATDAMASAAADVIRALRAAGAREVSTGRLMIRTDHDHEGRPSGFRSETAIVAEADIGAASGTVVTALVEAAVAAGGDLLSIDGIGFNNSDPTALEHDALSRAVAVAHARAETMARSAGVTVGPVIALEQVTQVVPGPIRYRAVQTEMADVPVEPGAQTITVEVKATYEIS